MIMHTQEDMHRIAADLKQAPRTPTESDRDFTGQLALLSTDRDNAALALQSRRPALLLRGCGCRVHLPILLRQLAHLLLQELV